MIKNICINNITALNLQFYFLVYRSIALFFQDDFKKSATIVFDS